MGEGCPIFSSKGGGGGGGEIGHPPLPPPIFWTKFQHDLNCAWPINYQKGDRMHQFFLK